MAVACAKICDDKKAKDIIILDVRKVTFIADYFILCSTTNDRQSKAVSDAVHSAMKAKGHRAVNDGSRGGDGRWMLQDFGDVVVHIFLEDARKFYDLDDLWADAKQIAWKRAKKTATAEGSTAVNF